MRSAVLFLIFNRPDTTRQVFEAIRAAKPPRLYVAADGPRPTRAGEHECCAEARRIATEVDWPCEVKTLFRDSNLGCKMGVSGGIEWFFEHEEEGVILEDDVLPLPSFFAYCDELLERYRHDDRVGMISGCNLVVKHFAPAHSYFFSRYNHIWGWASWRRAWRHYDVAMRSWREWESSGGLKKISDGSRAFEVYWSECFNNTYAGKIDTWDYQWTFACWRQEMMAVLPAQNQIGNLGFGPGATHTTEELPAYVRESAARLLSFPLHHPLKVERSQHADRLIHAKIFGVSPLVALGRRMKKVFWIAALITAVRRGLSNAK
ncbi:MAG: hypothetical protein ACOY41_04825 [Pseudomonadota bacterium]